VELLFLVVLAHAAAMGMRDRERLEYQASFGTAFTSMGRAIVYAVTPSRCELGHSNTLIVGDSMAVGWKWPADRIGLWGQPTDIIRAEFEQRISGRHYARIILWPGTAHFEAGGSIDQYVQDLRAMIAQATEHAEHVVLLSPIPDSRCRREAQEGFKLVRSAFPDLDTIDLSGWRQLAVASGRWGDWSEDGLHLNDTGKHHLGLLLASRGLDVPSFGINRLASAKPTRPF